MSIKPEVEIWQTFSIQNAKKINGKRRQIAKTSHSVKKSGTGNRMTTSEILLQVHK